MHLTKTILPVLALSLASFAAEPATAEKAEQFQQQTEQLQEMIDQLQKRADELKVQAEQIQKHRNTTEQIAPTPASEKKDDQKDAPATTKKYSLSLDEAKLRALLSNPTLAQMKSRIESAIAKVDQARSAYFPSIDLSAGITRNRDYHTRPLSDYDNSTHYEVGLSANYRLFDGFQRKFSVLQAKYGLATAEQEDQDARRTLLQAVAAAYYQVLMAQDSMNIAKHDADFNQLLLDDAQKRKEGGILKQSEVLNFVLGVQTAEVNYVNAEKNWRVAFVALGALLAMPTDNIWENIELVYPDAHHSKVESIPELLAFAREHRPDLLAAENTIQIARDAIEAAQNEWYPNVSLFYNHDYQRNDKLKFNRHKDRDVNFGIAATWNVFNGFKTQKHIEQTRADLTTAIRARDGLLIDIEKEIRQAYLAHLSNRIQLERQETVLQTATRIRELVHNEYTVGTANITRLNEVQTDVINAESARSAAFIQVLNSIEYLHAATAQNLYAAEHATKELKAAAEQPK
ncbi:MAG: TolC family protein [Victivallales bacterium]|nr:TolC family protein [Victivallales bacterium]